VAAAFGYFDPCGGVGGQNGFGYLAMCWGAVGTRTSEIEFARGWYGPGSLIYGAVIIAPQQR